MIKQTPVRVLRGASYMYDVGVSVTCGSCLSFRACPKVKVKVMVDVKVIGVRLRLRLGLRLKLSLRLRLRLLS